MPNGEAGLFVEERVELPNGEIITMAAQIPPRASVVSRIAVTFIRLLGILVTVRAQLPIVLNDRSEPEPDIALCRTDPNEYEREHPKADQVCLVIEVAEASFSHDRGRKAAVYAESGIPEYWIAKLVDRRVEIFSHSDPTAQRYLTERVVVAADTLALPTGLTIAAADILPRS